MLRGLLILITISSLAVPGVFAQKADSKSADETNIRRILTDLERAWTKGDGKAFAEPFADDADFVVWNGIYLKGRQAIAQGHQQIFNTVYKDTRVKIEVRQIRFLSDTVAVVLTNSGVSKKADDFSNIIETLPLFILSKENGKWQIRVFQNTRNTAGEERKN